MPDCIQTQLIALKARLCQQDGQTLVEYALLVVFIAMVVLVGVTALGTNLLALFSSFAASL